jgi:hypothetical protein
MSGQAAPDARTPAASAAPPLGTASAAPTLVVERPPPGLGRGQYAAPFWLLALLAFVAGALTLGFYVRHFRRGNPR